MILGDEEAKAAQEVAKAVQEVAKTAGKAIEASQEMGVFFNRVFGGLVENSVGLLADKLQYYRAEKLVLLYEKTKKKLQEQGIQITHPVLAKIGIPLIEQATIESDDNLHSLWANMLKNAMNPEYKGNIKRSYISILSDMESLDVLILDTLANEYYISAQKEQTLFVRSLIAQRLEISVEQCEISLRNLMRLGCIRPGVIMLKTDGTITTPHDLSSYKDTEQVAITTSGIAFHKAVN